jgi:glycopeptide antibiotics resistance protein
MLLGLMMEVMQLIMQIGRGYDNMDIVANCMGAMLGLAYMKWKGLKSYRHSMLLHSAKHHKHHHRKS